MDSDLLKLYSYETDRDSTVLDCPQITNEDHHPILREEVETAVKAFKTTTSAGVDDTQAELGQAEETRINVLS